MGRRALIIGGTGQIGLAVARSLLTHGWQVTLAHRGSSSAPAELIGQGATIAKLDRDEPDALASALGQGADAVIDTVAYTCEHARQLLAVQAGIGSIVAISSASVYRDHAGRTLDEAMHCGFPELPVPIPETQPTVAPGPQTYSTRKRELEIELIDKARCNATILRLGAVHGPNSQHPREWWFVKRLLDRRKLIPLAYEGASQFHVASTVNIAELIRVALEAPGSRVLNAADPTAPTVSEIGALIAERLERHSKFVGIADTGYPPRIGATPWSIPQPFVLDLGAAAAIGYAPVNSYADAVGATCSWLIEAAGKPGRDWRDSFPVLARYPYDLFDYSAEDRFFEKMRITDIES
jgi:nucleoside-diphosphate-sugar epimerase